MVLSILITAFAACVFTEIIGYYLHILLHSDKIEFLSRNHMIHHLIIYKPKQPMRKSGHYLNSTEGRLAIDGTGVEWLVPGGIILTAFYFTTRAFGMPPFLQAIFAVTAILWGRFIFGHMHDAMHLKDFWMEKHPLTRSWFLSVRRRHDVHHMDIADDGRMTTNFGICFFFMDRLRGTLLDKARPFNQKGYDAALKLYANLLKQPPTASY